MHKTHKTMAKNLAIEWGGHRHHPHQQQKTMTNTIHTVPARDLLRSFGEIGYHDKKPSTNTRAIARTLYDTMIHHAKGNGFTNANELNRLLARGDRGHRAQTLASEAVAAIGGELRTHTVVRLLMGHYGPVDRVIRDFNQQHGGTQ